MILLIMVASHGEHAPAGARPPLPREHVPVGEKTAPWALIPSKRTHITDPTVAGGPPRPSWSQTCP